MKKFLFVFLFVAFAYPVFAETLVYDSQDNLVGELRFQGLLFKKDGTDIYGAQIWVPSLKKIVNVSTVDGMVLNDVELGFGEAVMGASNTIGSWQGVGYFISGGTWSEWADVRGNFMSGFVAEYCDECLSMFPVKTPLKYEASN